MTAAVTPHAQQPNLAVDSCSDGLLEFAAVDIEVETEGEAVADMKSYACAPEACAVCYRHSQLGVLRAVDAALAERMESVAEDALSAGGVAKKRKLGAYSSHE